MPLHSVVGKHTMSYWPVLFWIIFSKGDGAVMQEPFSKSVTSESMIHFNEGTPDVFVAVFYSKEKKQTNEQKDKGCT